MHPSARDEEAALIERCAAVAQGTETSARDIREANLFHLAGMIVGPRRRTEAARLLQASDRYFSARPADRLDSAEVVRRGWVSDLPRLRQLIELTLRE